MLNFDLKSTVSDLEQLSQLLADYWHTVPDDAWQRRTGEREKDWTLHQTLAHLVSVARLFNLSVHIAIQGQARVKVEGLDKRADLWGWNQSQIQSLCTVNSRTLQEHLAAELLTARTLAQTLSAETYTQQTYLPVYNRPARTIDLLIWQLSHPGVLHAAQITRPVGVSPLWTRYPEDFLYRQVRRFLRHFSYGYWQEYGNGLYAKINFTIEGNAGGEWHIIAAPDGGDVDEGFEPDAQYHLLFSSPAAFFSLFTIETTLSEALASKALNVEGDVSDTMAVIRLFGATPPGQKYRSS